MAVTPSASDSITVRLEIRNRPGMPGRVALTIGEAGAVSDEMKLGAARAIADCVAPGELSAEYIIPSVFNKSVAPAVAGGVARAAHETGLARRGRGLDLPGVR